MKLGILLIFLPGCIAAADGSSQDAVSGPPNADVAVSVTCDPAPCYGDSPTVAQCPADTREEIVDGKDICVPMTHQREAPAKSFPYAHGLEVEFWAFQQPSNNAVPQ